MRSKTHKITLTVTFDKPCNRAQAVAAVKDNVHGTFYPVAYTDADPEEFRVRSVRSAK